MCDTVFGRMGSELDFWLNSDGVEMLLARSTLAWLLFGLDFLPKRVNDGENVNVEHSVDHRANA